MLFNLERKGKTVKPDLHFFATASTNHKAQKEGGLKLPFPRKLKPKTSLSPKIIGGGGQKKKGRRRAQFQLQRNKNSVFSKTKGQGRGKSPRTPHEGKGKSSSIAPLTDSRISSVNEKESLILFTVSVSQHKEKRKKKTRTVWCVSSCPIKKGTKRSVRVDQGRPKGGSRRVGMPRTTAWENATPAQARLPRAEGETGG